MENPELAAIRQIVREELAAVKQVLVVNMPASCPLSAEQVAGMRDSFEALLKSGEPIILPSGWTSQVVNPLASVEIRRVPGAREKSESYPLPSGWALSEKQPEPIEIDCYSVRPPAFDNPFYGKKA